MSLSAWHLAALGPQVGQSPAIDSHAIRQPQVPEPIGCYNGGTPLRIHGNKPPCSSFRMNEVVEHTGGRLRLGTYRPGRKGLHRHPLAMLCHCRAPGCSRSGSCLRTTPHPASAAAERCLTRVPQAHSGRQSGDVQQAKECLTHAAQLLCDAAPDSSQASRAAGLAAIQTSATGTER